jgi:hypothetical protein
MNLLPSFGLLSASALCVALVACAGTAEPVAPTVIRTLPPEGYEKAITNYLAFRLRGARKNGQITVGQPEPGSCSLDSHANSMRGWVVPVVYETRTGEVTGKETIKVTVKQYYFWFLAETIAGVTPRIELCPDVASAFDEAPQTREVAAKLPAGAAQPQSDPAQREEASPAESSKKAQSQSKAAKKKAAKPASSK